VLVLTKKIEHLRSKSYCTVFKGLATVVNFTNILQAAFAPISLCQKIQTQTASTEKLHKTLLYENGAH